MKVLFTKILSFAVPLLVLMLATSVISRKVMVNGDYYKLRPGVNTMLMGHSHIQCSVNDNFLTGMQNQCMSGEAYYYTYLKLKKLVYENPQVKTIILSYTNNQIDHQMDSWIWSEASLYRFYPKFVFLFEREDYEVLLENNPKSVLLSEIKFVKKFTTFMMRRSGDFLEAENWGGYFKLERNKLDSILKSDYVEKEWKLDYSKISKTNIDYLKKIKAFCRENNVELIFMRAPIRPEWPHNKNEKLYDTIKQQYFRDIEMMDFKDFPATVNEMGDLEHMNIHGAIRFSKFFNDLLANGLLKSSDKQKDIDQAIKKLSLKDSISG